VVLIIDRQPYRTYPGSPSITEFPVLNRFPKHCRGAFVSSRNGTNSLHHRALKKLLFVLILRDNNAALHHHIEAAQLALDRFLATSGVTTIHQIDSRTIEQFMQLIASGDEKHRPGSPRTQNKYRALLAAWLGWAVRRGHLAANPAAAVGRVKEIRTFKPFPMPAEFTGLVDSTSDRYDAALWVLFALTGLRRGSLVSLTGDCFQDDGIRVPSTKRGSEWFISYDDGCPLWRPELSVIGRWVWSIRPPTPDYIRNHFEQTCQAFGKRFTVHSLRHAFASWLVMMNEHDSDIASWLHHSTPAMCQKHYAHLRPHGQKRVAANRKSVRTMRARVLEVTMQDIS